MKSDVIHLLPDSVANQIAAGEVIQRPASVIKELVENSVDAGADQITIVIRDAGRTLIQVIDNGCGMSPTDARMAFERHATSKISSAADLYSLHTMGFRGEALPSVAAVAQIDLRTMRAGDSVGTRLTVSESRFEGQEPCVCAPGTNLSVKNIFFHMPARRKFLKKDSIELSHILREFERLALVNTSVEFTLIHNDVTLHQLLRGSFKERIAGLFGKTLGSQLAPLTTETSIVRISGFVGLPRFARRRGAQQYFFVNGRNMIHRPFHKAVMRCYEPLLAPDTNPSYFINFDVDPASIDVNIHPQKYEIKFEHEQAIFQILEAAIRETLGKTQAAGALDFDADEQFDIPLYNPDTHAAVPDDGADMGSSGGLRAAAWDAPVHKGAPAATLRPAGASTRYDWEQLYENFSRRRDEGLDGLRPSAMNSGGDAVLSGISDQLAEQATAVGDCVWLPGGYICAAVNRTLTILHQHRAHIRILFEDIIARLAKGTLSSQKLIFGEDIELPPDQSALLLGLRQEIEALGFSVTHADGAAWSIDAIPAIAGAGAPGEVLQDVLAAIPDGADSAEAMQTPVALALSRKGAIPPDKILSQAEMQSLVAELFATGAPACTPDGLAIYSVVGPAELERRFS